MNKFLIVIAILASIVGSLIANQTKAQDSICQDTDLSFLTNVYAGIPSENAVRIKLFTDSGYGSAAMVTIEQDVFFMTAGHVAWQANLEEMSIFVPGCGVLPEIINPENYVVYKFAQDWVMLYPVGSEVVNALQDIVEPLEIAENPAQSGDTIYFPEEATEELLPYYVVSANEDELYTVMWYEDDEVCVSMSGSSVLNEEGDIIGVLSSAPNIAESNNLEDCFLQAYIVPLG